MNEILITLILALSTGPIIYLVIDLYHSRKKQREENEERHTSEGCFSLSFKTDTGITFNLAGLTSSDVRFINDALDNDETTEISVSLIGEFELSSKSFPKKKP